VDHFSGAAPISCFSEPEKRAKTAHFWATIVSRKTRINLDLRCVTAGTSREDNCLAVIDENTVMDVGTDGLRKNLALNIPAKGNIVLGALGMGDAHGVLFNNRTFIQIRRYIVRRRADELHAALERLLIRVGALNLGKKE
jgi:hypothetical protein